MCRKSKSNRNRKAASTTTLRCRQPGYAEERREIIRVALAVLAMASQAKPKAHPDGATPHFIPRMDTMDDPDSKRTIAIFELPGVRNDDMKLHVYEGRLHVQGTRWCRAPQEYTTCESTVKVECSEPTINNHQYTHKELRYGTFSRKVKLPSGVKEDEMAATLRDGLLIVHWPTPELHPVDASSAHDKSGTM